MDAPFNSRDVDLPRSRRPLSAWIPLALIVAVLTLAGLGAASVTDTRDFAQKHASVLPGHAL